MYLKDINRKVPLEYDYKDIVISRNKVPVFVECYKNFGWSVDENTSYEYFDSYTKVKMKRERKIINKMELTRLQRNFEACVKEVKNLELTKTKFARTSALSVGILGIVILIGAILLDAYAVTFKCISTIMTVLGVLGCVLPYFIFQRIRDKQEKKLQPFIDEKCEEIRGLCKKGCALL